MTWFVVERTSNPQTFSIAEQIQTKGNRISTVFVAHVCDGQTEQTAKLLADAPDLKAERDALRASLRDMVEYAEEYRISQESGMGGYKWLCLEQLKADIAKARGLLE